MKCPYCAIKLDDKCNVHRDAGCVDLRMITCGECYTCSSWVRGTLRGWTPNPETSDGISRTVNRKIP